MPELPEVETIARQLVTVVRGRRIRGLDLYDPKLEHLPKHLLKGHVIQRVFRAGKQLVLEMGDPPEIWLVIHLRMTGRLLWRGSARLRDRKHLRARIRCDQGCLLFYDPRRFGTLEVRQHEAELEGVDPTTNTFTVAALTELLKNSTQPIKPWLMRQDRLVGLGNIYASEILFEARVDPRRRAGSLTRPETRRLHASTRAVLARAIQSGGTTFSDFQDARGLTGSFQRYLKVYGREGEPCPLCRAPVTCVVQQQRSTFFCPRCQRNPRRPVSE